MLVPCCTLNFYVFTTSPNILYTDVSPVDGTMFEPVCVPECAALHPPSVCNSRPDLFDADLHTAVAGL